MNSRNEGASVYGKRHLQSHFMQVPNKIVRGETPIHTRYVGVWCYINSHSEGWKLTEKKIAQALGVGREFVRNALASIEEAGLLIRTQDRDAKAGKYGPSIWFTTDLPFFLETVGITDPDEVRKRVEQEYAEFRLELQRRKNPSSQPLSGNPTTVNDAEPVDNSPVDNSTDVGKPDNGDDQAKHQDSPMSGFPMSADPTTGNPTHKKTNEKKTNQKNNKKKNPSPHYPSNPHHARDMAGEPGGEEISQGEDPEPAPEPVSPEQPAESSQAPKPAEAGQLEQPETPSTPVDAPQPATEAAAADRTKLAANLLRSLLDGPAHGLAEPPTAEKHELVTLVMTAWRAGASSAEVREALACDLEDVKHVGKVWISRLNRLVSELGSSKPAPLPPVCGQCEGRPGDGGAERLVVGEDGRMRKCPRCHPAYAHAAAAPVRYSA